MRALHPAAALALAALCVLAGCGGITGPEGDGPSTDRTSVTPADVPEDLHGGTVAPGLTRDRLVNVSALATAHEAALRNRSVTVRWNGTRAASTGGTDVDLIHARTVSRYGPGHRRAHYVTRYGPSEDADSREELWLGSDRGFQLLVDGGERRYRALRQPTADRFRGLSFDLEGLYGVTRVRVEQIRTADGHPLYRVRAVEPRAPDTSLAGQRDYETRDVSLVMTVDERGTIHSYRFGYEFRVDGEWRHYWTAYELRAVGETTVERPDWYDEAVAATQNRTTAR